MRHKHYPKEVIEYLKRKAISRWNLEWNEINGIENVIVVPAIAEYPNIKNLMQSLIKNDYSLLQNSLVTFVINNSVSSNKGIKEDNRKSLDLLKSIIQKHSNDQFLNEIVKSRINIGMIDASSEGNEFNDKEAGVGLARKIGLDVALTVFDYSKPGKKILFCLDADCIIEDNYLTEINSIFNSENVSVATIDFEHISPQNQILRKGIESYEIFLRHYVTGLLFAKSPFAYHTIGSTIVFNHEAYVKAGGMNTRKAAEDFYFLQKLAKHYDLHKISSTKVKPSARESWRVPFGTGKSMTDYLSKQKEILLYDPEEFVILKNWLEVFNSNLAVETNHLIKESEKIHPELFNFLESRNFSRDWNQILRNSKSEKQINYQRINWFDAFKTLKLMHHLRDTSFPMIDIRSGIEKLFGIVGHEFKVADKQDDKNNLRNYLSELKIVENSLNKNFANQYF